MPEKILGIDIAGSGIKVVQVTRGFRTSQVSGYARAQLTCRLQIPRKWPSSLADLIAEENLESDRYMVALGTHEAFFAAASFPLFQSTQDFPSNPVRNGALTCLWLLMRFQVDFCHHGNPSKPAPHGVLGAALPQNCFWIPLLAALKEVNIEPEVVDLDGKRFEFLLLAN